MSGRTSVFSRSKSSSSAEEGTRSFKSSSVIGKTFSKLKKKVKGGKGRKQKESKVTESLKTMQKGSKMSKVRSKGKRYERNFQLEGNSVSFKYTDSKKFHWLRKLIRSGRDMSRVKISEIIEVRDGPISDVFVKAKLTIPDEHCFSLVIGDKHRTLDLVTESEQVKDAWLLGLNHLLKKRKDANEAAKEESWLKELFRKADKNNDHTLSLDEIIGLLKHLQMEVDRETAKSVFEQADVDKTKEGEDSLDIEEFVHFYKLITSREDIEEIFEDISEEDREYLTADNLREFFEDYQEQKISKKKACQLIDELEPSTEFKTQKKMSIDGFKALLGSPHMDVFEQDHTKVYQDMTRPLSHYFIDSSHNTYLSGHQLMGKSAVEEYIRALKRGCRCVELDCWDGEKGSPIIYHGHTRTSKILFSDVIGAINEWAFAVSEYPVILSLENHCSEVQQRLMAKYLKDTFGDKLLKTPLKGSVTSLPSPEQLKGRIIIKGKKLKVGAKGQEEEEEDDEDNYVDSDSDQDDAIMATRRTIKRAMSIIKRDQKSTEKQKKHKLAKELSDLVVICQSVRFKGFDYAKTHYNFKQMSSYGEKKARRLAQKFRQEWRDLNEVQLSRVYPAGKRVDSSNYDPFPMWLSGAQLVALNYQTADENMHINKGMFLDNGGCGYVLKPSFAEIVPCGDDYDDDDYDDDSDDYDSSDDDDDSDNDPDDDDDYDDEGLTHLDIEVISGYQLPKKKGDILDPYVTIDIKEGRKKSKKQKQTGKTVVYDNNGFNPKWYKELEFLIHKPELALVYFRVWDHDIVGKHELMAHYCLPFKSLRSGYRTVHLKSKHGTPIEGAQLLIDVTIYIE